MGSDRERHYQIVSAAARQLDLKILCPEYEIIIALYEEGATPARELSKACSWSSSAFFAALSLLSAQNVVKHDEGQHDHRERIYDLTDDVRRLLDERFGQLSGWLAQHIGISDAKVAFKINEFVRFIETKLKIRFFTHEYEFILFMYEHGVLSPSELAAMMKSSSSTIFNVIEKLTRKKIIAVEDGLRDRRRKVYHLTPETVAFLDRLHRRLYRFLQDRLPGVTDRESPSA